MRVVGFAITIPLWLLLCARWRQVGESLAYNSGRILGAALISLAIAGIPRLIYVRLTRRSPSFWSPWLFFIAALVLLLAEAGRAGQESEQAARFAGQPFGPEIRVVAPQANDGVGRRIRRDGLFLVPLDDTPRPLLARIAGRIGRKYRVHAAVLPRLRTERQAFDRDRRQLEGGGLVDQLSAAYPTRNLMAAVVGVTNGDLYFAGARDDRFAFGVRAGNRYAVVSTARMDPENYGGEPDARLLERRLETMVTRYLGTLHFHLARTDNPESAMRSSIRTLDDLDEASPELCPDRPGEAVSC